jgi:outer membrane receptor for ferrienterochelin and colicins
LRTLIYIAIFLLGHQMAFAQNGLLKGTIKSDKNEAIPFATISILETGEGVLSDENGSFELSLKNGQKEIQISSIGFANFSTSVLIKPVETVFLNVILHQSTAFLDEVVVTGTMKEVSRLETPVPVEIYTPQFFKRNPTPNIFEGLQNVNGVRPQLNCNVCNTGDIHINGLEGP